VRANGILLDAFTRVSNGVPEVLEGLDNDDLSLRADREANSIAWLIWHLTRVQDDHVAEVAGREQAWVAAGWAGRFNLGLDIWDTGYGHRTDDVGQVRASAELLAGYHAAVYEETARFVKGLDDADLDRVVDRRWDPPVTLGVRLVSVIEDGLQHLGQAAFLKGLLRRRRAASS